MVGARHFGLWGIVLLAGIASGCSRRSSPPAVALPTVRVVTAMPGSFREGVHYSVSLVPNRQADVVFRSAGIVDRIRSVRGADGRLREIGMGDAVTTGEVLAGVRTAEYQHALDQAQARLRGAAAQRDGAQASLALAQSNFARAAHLYQEQSLTRQDYDRAQQQRDSSAAAMQQAEAAIAEAGAAAAQARTALADTAATAPFSGVVVTRSIEPGDMAGSSTPAFTIADISLLKADFTVPEAALPEVRLGRQIAVRLADDTQELPARIAAVSPAADPQSRVFTVQLTIPNPRGELKPGMIGSIELEPHAQTQPHIMVPVDALVQSPSDHGFALFVAGQGLTPQVRLRPVKIGSTEGSRVEILSGVSVGERIVSSGAQILHDNETVRVLE